jgi:hypothetical protein
MRRRKHGAAVLSALVAAVLAGSCFGPDPEWTPQPPTMGTVYDYCAGDNDGVIERGEVVFLDGAEVAYRVNAPGTVVEIDTWPAAAGGRDPAWDFRDLGDSEFTLTYHDVGREWFSDRFPRAGLWTQLDHLSGLVALYGLFEDRMEFYGTVSLEPDRVFLPYTEPVTVLRFPLRVGDAWTVTTGVRDGVSDGLPVSSDETYAFEVVTSADLLVGSFRFKNTLLLRARLHQSFPGGVEQDRVQYVWLHECWGELARATATDFSDGSSVIRASEFRRIHVD